MRQLRAHDRGIDGHTPFQGHRGVLGGPISLWENSHAILQ